MNIVNKLALRLIIRLRFLSIPKKYLYITHASKQTIKTNEYSINRSVKNIVGTFRPPAQTKLGNRVKSKTKYIIILLKFTINTMSQGEEFCNNPDQIGKLFQKTLSSDKNKN